MFFQHDVYVHEGDVVKRIRFKKEYTDKIAAKIASINNIFGKQNYGDLLEMDSDGNMIDLSLSIFNTMQDLIRIISMIFHRKYRDIVFDLGYFRTSDEVVNNHTRGYLENILKYNAIDIYSYVTMMSIHDDIHLNIISSDVAMYVNNEWIISYLKKFIIQDKINTTNIDIFREYIKTVPVYMFVGKYSNVIVNPMILRLFFNTALIGKDISYVAIHDPLLSNKQYYVYVNPQSVPDIKKYINALAIGVNMTIEINGKTISINNIGLEQSGTVIVDCSSNNVVASEVESILTNPLLVTFLNSKLQEMYKFVPFDLHFAGYNMDVFSNISETVTDIDAYITKLQSIANIDNHSVYNTTKTSLTYEGINEFSVMTIHDILLSYFFKEGTTNSYKNANIFAIPNANIAVLLNDNNSIHYRFKHIASMEEFLWNLLFVFSDPITNSATAALTKEGILEECRENVKQKKYLQILYNEDSITFGPREVNGKVKQYSGNAQNIESRTCLLSEQKYNILAAYGDMQDRILAMPNQSNQERMLYLVCPFDESPIINFHDFKNQNCIVKCTMKQSNKKQAQVCMHKLGIGNSSMKIGISMFTTNLSVGGMCMLPPEIAQLFAKYNVTYYLYNPENPPSENAYIISTNDTINGQYVFPPNLPREDSLLAFTIMGNVYYFIKDPLSPEESFISLNSEELIVQWLHYSIDQSVSQYHDSLQVVLNKIFGDVIPLDEYSFEKVVCDEIVVGYNVTYRDNTYLLTIPFDIGLESSTKTVERVVDILQMRLPPVFNNDVIISVEDDAQQIIACAHDQFIILTKKENLRRECNIRAATTIDIMLINLYYTDIVDSTIASGSINDFVYFWLAISKLNYTLPEENIEEMASVMATRMEESLDNLIALYEDLFHVKIDSSFITPDDIKYSIVTLYVRTGNMEQLLQEIQYNPILSTITETSPYLHERYINNL